MFKFKSRYTPYYTLATVLIALLLFFYTAQVGVLLWKLALLLLAISVAILLSRAAITAPIEARNPLLLNNPTVSAAICIARALVIMACVIAICLGV